MQCMTTALLVITHNQSAVRPLPLILYDSILQCSHTLHQQSHCKFKMQCKQHAMHVQTHFSDMPQLANIVQLHPLYQSSTANYMATTKISAAQLQPWCNCSCTTIATATLCTLHWQQLQLWLQLQSFCKSNPTTTTVLYYITMIIYDDLKYKTLHGNLS